ncbi:MAG: sulfur oxidation c-type cytochrome SoxX [Rhabdaerophilum sp.]
MKKTLVLTALVSILAFGASAQDKPKVNAATLEAVTKAMWPKTPEGWQNRVSFDDTQKQCSEHRNEPPNAVFDAIKTREIATLKFPADGNVIGDWKAGKRIANDGRGGTFTDQPMNNGANCYACHQLDLAELSYGTLGPSLHLYGKNRGFKPEEAKAAYAKIFNAMSVMPCSMMPRFGYHGFLTEQQMKDVTALLFDPESPVNK